MSAEKQTPADGAEPPEQETAQAEVDIDTAPATEETSESAEPGNELAERVADLKRVTAEYHNYRKRVERDKAQLSEQVTASVVTGLLPILDDIDRARDHGDLEGPFASVAEQLQNTLTKLGLEVFGEKGDPFDPMVHEAVAHMHSPDVAEASCIDVMRRGYRIGERLLRPAMVAVAEPETPPAGDLGVEPEPEGALEPVADSADEPDVEDKDKSEDEENSAESSESSESKESKEKRKSDTESETDTAEPKDAGKADNGKSTAADERA